MTTAFYLALFPLLWRRGTTSGHLTVSAPACGIRKKPFTKLTDIDKARYTAFVFAYYPERREGYLQRVIGNGKACKDVRTEAFNELCKITEERAEVC